MLALLTSLTDLYMLTLAHELGSILRYSIDCNLVCCTYIEVIHMHKCTVVQHIINKYKTNNVYTTTIYYIGREIITYKGYYYSALMH